MILWFDMSRVNLKSIGRKDIVYILLVIVILYGIIFFQEYRETKLLEEFGTTSAIVTNKSSGYKGSNSIYVKYKIDGKTYTSKGIQLNSCTDKFKIGETVLIKFSLKDPKVVSIIDCEEDR